MPSLLQFAEGHSSPYARSKTTSNSRGNRKVCRQVKDDSAVICEKEENALTIVSTHGHKTSVHCPEHGERDIELYCKTCEDIETIQAQLSSCLQFWVDNLGIGNPAEALMMRRGTVEQVNELTAAFQDDLLEPSVKANITFLAFNDFAAECRTYGHVAAVGPPDPDKCSVIEQSKLEQAKVGEISTAVIAPFDSDNHPCNVQDDAITCELVSERSGTRVRGDVKARGNSYYEISYVPTVKGKHQLCIKVDGVHIEGSPYTVFTELPTEKIGYPIITVGDMIEPTGVAVNQQGEVLVTEWGGHCVTWLGLKYGESLRTFGSYGHFEGQLRNPHGIAVDDVGNVYVADCNHLRIQKFSSQGVFLMEKNTGILQWRYPRGIAFSTCNGLLYVSCGNGCIEVFNSDLMYIGKFCEKGNDLGQLEMPRHIACDKVGNVYVADSGNHRIQVFTADGKFLKMLGTGGCGGGKGELCDPFGIAIDSCNRVFVSERSNHRISVFTSEGKFVTSFGIEGREPGDFQEPAGLAFDSEGVLYVCDQGNNRIQLF